MQFYIKKAEFDTEKAEIENSHRQESQELKNMILTIKEEEEAKLTNMKNLFDADRESAKNKSAEDVDSIKHELTRRIEDND